MDNGSAKAAGNDAEFERLRVLIGQKKAEVAAMQAEAKTLDADLAAMLMGPLMKQLNIPDMGGHMFLLYFASLSAITPPVRTILCLPMVSPAPTAAFLWMLLSRRSPFSD